MKKYLIITTAVLTLLLAACGNKSMQENTAGNRPAESTDAVVEANANRPAAEMKTSKNANNSENSSETALVNDEAENTIELSENYPVKPEEKAEQAEDLQPHMQADNSEENPEQEDSAQQNIKSGGKTEALPNPETCPYEHNTVTMSFIASETVVVCSDTSETYIRQDTYKCFHCGYEMTVDEEIMTSYITDTGAAEEIYLVNEYRNTYIPLSSGDRFEDCDFFIASSPGELANITASNGIGREPLQGNSYNISELGYSDSWFDENELIVVIMSSPSPNTKPVPVTVTVNENSLGLGIYWQEPEFDSDAIGTWILLFRAKAGTNIDTVNIWF